MAAWHIIMLEDHFQAGSGDQQQSLKEKEMARHPAQKRGKEGMTSIPVTQHLPGSESQAKTL